MVQHRAQLLYVLLLPVHILSSKVILPQSCPLPLAYKPPLHFWFKILHSKLFCLMYINDVNDLILSPGSKLVLYADDILLYCPVISENDYTLLQRDVDALGVWSLLNLSFNIKKCKSMTLSQKNMKTQSSPIILLGSQLDIVDSIKYRTLAKEDPLRNIGPPPTLSSVSS